jgi:tRNA dimethylallyltransferase
MTLALSVACAHASRRVSVSGAAAWREVARRQNVPGRETPTGRCRVTHRFVRWTASSPTSTKHGPGRSLATAASSNTRDVVGSDETFNDNPKLPSNPKLPKVLVIAGPTAVGKTKLSLAMALRLNGEVVSADSVQVFKGLDVGSGKLPVQLRQGVKHHLLDIANPNEDVGAGDYVDRALRAIDDIVRRGKTPIVVGGTGMYLRWLIDGKPNTPPSDPDTALQAKEILRKVAHEASAATNDSQSQSDWHSKKQNKTADEVESDAIAFAKWNAAMVYLQSAGDKTIGDRLARNDWYRAERALAVLLQSGGKPVVEFAPDEVPTYQFTCILLSSPRVSLYRRVDFRVEEMVRDGLLDEATELLLSGMTPGSTPASRAIGYRQAMGFLMSLVNDDLNDRCSHGCLLEFVEETQRATRAFAKRQFTWFRGEKDGRYVWLDTTKVTATELQEVVSGLFSGEFSGEDTQKREAGEKSVPKKEETKENSPAFDSTRGEADHATSQELKRYAPEQSIFVDEEASRESRTHVDALVQKIRKHRS